MVRANGDEKETAWALDGREVGGEQSMYMCGWAPLLFPWNCHNIVRLIGSTPMQN